MAWTDDLSRIQFQATDTHIQWRYIGTATWNNLLAFSASLPVTGPLTNDQLRAAPVPVVAGVTPRIPSTTSVASSTSSTTLAELNPNRKGLFISNFSTSKLYLSFNSVATVANSFVELEAGKYIPFDQQLITGNAITGVWLSANGSAQVTEFI